MTSFETPTFDSRAVAALMGRISIDRSSLESAIRRTVAELAGQVPPRSTCKPVPVAVSKPRKARADTIAFPGGAPTDWSQLTPAQRQWCRGRYSWHPTLFLAGGTVPKKSPGEWLDQQKRADKWGRKRPKVPPVGRTVAEWGAERDGLAFVLPYRWDWNRLQRDGHAYPNMRAKVQYVLETDPVHFKTDWAHYKDAHAFLTRAARKQMSIAA